MAGRNLSYGAVELFLFSAATWNPHRVHYDQHYTRGRAGQSGLLVQGPLQAATMFQALRDGLAEGVIIQSLEYRHLAVLHAGEPARIAGRLSGVVEDDTVTVEMWVESMRSGQRTTTGIARLRRAASTPVTLSRPSLEGDR
jgi:3-methylfumaryl-CoA hydratase